MFQFKNALICMILVPLTAFLGGQGSKFSDNYTPCLELDTIIAQTYVKQMETKLEADLESIKSYDKKIKNDLDDIYNYRFDELKQTINKSEIIHDALIAPYLRFILKEIYRANPGLDTSVRLLVYRTDIPNASTWGEGTILFNLGLLARLENESQVAFILCHELAHHYSNHVNSSILQRLTKLHSKETAQQLRDVKSSQYNTYTKFKKLIDDLSFNFGRHSRYHETEADSIALSYLFKTSYDAAESSRCLAILDSCDTEKYLEIINLKKHFDSPQFPYKPLWSDYKKTEMYHISFEERENADSLKNHPDCPQRIKAAEKQLKRLGYSANGKVKSMKGDNYFNEFVESVDFEMVQSDYQRKDIGRALFNALLLLNKYPDNIYLHAMVGLCFYQIHTHQKNHELGKIVTMPGNSHFDENYDRLLTFIHQLRLSDMENIGFHYVQKFPETYHEDENFLYAYYMCSKMHSDGEAMDRAKNQYLGSFPEGRYKKDFD